MERVSGCALASVVGFRSEGTSKSDDSHKNISCRIDGTMAGSWRFVSYIVPVAHPFKADRVVDSYFLSIGSQRNKKPDHKTHTQRTQRQHGVNRDTRNCIRRKHSSL